MRKNLNTPIERKNHNFQYDPILILPNRDIIDTSLSSIRKYRCVVPSRITRERHTGYDYYSTTTIPLQYITCVCVREKGTEVFITLMFYRYNMQPD